MSKIKKLAVIRSGKSCPFGLLIPGGCKNAGKIVRHMSPLNILKDITPEEQAEIAKANNHLLNWKSPCERCMYAGVIFKDKLVVECNWSENDAGSQQQGSLIGSPFYYKMFSGTGLDGLFSYPLGYYTDNSIDRGIYMGPYSIENIGENKNKEIKK